VKTVYQCENCKAIWSKHREAIKFIHGCVVCGNDVCEKCVDHVFCVVTQASGHKGCMSLVNGEYYTPGQENQSITKKKESE